MGVHLPPLPAAVGVTGKENCTVGVNLQNGVVQNCAGVNMSKWKNAACYCDGFKITAQCHQDQIG